MHSGQPHGPLLFSGLQDTGDGSRRSGETHGILTSPSSFSSRLGSAPTLPQISFECAACLLNLFVLIGLSKVAFAAMKRAQRAILVWSLLYRGLHYDLHVHLHVHCYPRAEPSFEDLPWQNQPHMYTLQCCTLLQFIVTAVVHNLFHLI